MKDLERLVGRLAMQLLKWLTEKHHMSQSWSMFGVLESFFLQWFVDFYHFKTKIHQSFIARFWMGNIQSQAMYRYSCKTLSARF